MEFKVLGSDSNTFHLWLLENFSICLNWYFVSKCRNLLCVFWTITLQFLSLFGAFLIQILHSLFSFKQLNVFVRESQISMTASFQKGLFDFRFAVAFFLWLLWPDIWRTRITAAMEFRFRCFNYSSIVVFLQLAVNQMVYISSQVKKQ